MKAMERKTRLKATTPSLMPPRSKILQGIINLGTQDQVPALPKSGEKRGPGHLDGSIGSDLSAEDLDAKDTRSKKKGSTPVNMTSNTGQWTEEDLDMVCQVCYKTDLERFQKYRRNKLTDR